VEKIGFEPGLKERGVLSDERGDLWWRKMA